MNAGAGFYNDEGMLSRRADQGHDKYWNGEHMGSLAIL